MTSTKKTLVEVNKRNFEEGTAKSFECRFKGKKFKGVVLKTEGKFFAYQNLCRHLPIPLDLEDDNFFSHDRVHLQCQMHGALYELKTGECVGGPCVGSSLNPLVVIEEPKRLLVEITEDNEDSNE